MSVVIGLDPSSKKVALAISINGKTPVLRRRELGFKEIEKNCYSAFRYTRMICKEYAKYGEVTIYIEEPVVGRGGVYSTLRQTKVNGALLAGAVSAGANVVPVNNSTWKKHTVGKGNAGKPQIEQYLIQANPLMHHNAEGDQDLMDAICILEYGMKHKSGAIPAPAKRSKTTRSKK